ncbi:MAG TPA: TIGR03546 family protein [bacterium]|nr:TIGR03546 family protein [bacterium]
MIFLKILSKFIRVLRSAASPNQIAWGFALGAIAGLTPLNALHNLAVLILLIILNVNIAAAILALTIFSLIAWLFDPFFHTIGYAVLVQLSWLRPAWTDLYNAPVAPLTRFNNTVVMGGLLTSLVLLIPNYLLFRWFVIRYRESWNDRIRKWKVVQILKSSKIVRFYLKIRGMEG